MTAREARNENSKTQFAHKVLSEESDNFVSHRMAESVGHNFEDLGICL